MGDDASSMDLEDLAVPEAPAKPRTSSLSFTLPNLDSIKANADRQYSSQHKIKANTPRETRHAAKTLTIPRKHKRSRSTAEREEVKTKKKRRKKKKEEEQTDSEDIRGPELKRSECLETLSKLSKQEFEMFSDQFKDLDVHKKGSIGKAEFRKCLGMLGDLKNGASDDFVTMIFKAFDLDGDDVIVFPEFLEIMAILLKGTQNQKIAFAFGLCNGRSSEPHILKSDIYNVIGIMFGILQKIGISLPKDPCSVADRLFLALDKKNDGKVTLDSFTEVVRTQPMLLRGLGLFDPKINALYELQTSGSCVTFGNANWGLMLNIMIGIRLSISTSEKTVHLLPRHYTERQSLPLAGKFSFDMSIMDKFSFGSEKMEENEFVNYAPMIFKNARQLAGIEEESFVLSLGPEQLLGNMLCGKLASMKCKSSEGKSGSFFFSSHDGRFLVKTIYHREKMSLEKFLPTYFEHLIGNPNTLLNLIFGFHRIGLIPFIVLQNIFYSKLPIDEVYDLKGSEWGRTNDGVGVMKDLDFQRNEKRLNLTPDVKMRLIQQIDADTKFLEELQLIDYSLLIGIHNVEKHKPAAPKSPRKKIVKKETRRNSFTFAQINDGILSSDGKEIYFIGIIDYLTVYGMRKTAETLIRSTFLQQQRDKISTVPPAEYAERFRNFMRSIC